MKWTALLLTSLLLMLNGLVAQDQDKTNLKEYLNLAYLNNPSDVDLQSLNLVIPTTQTSMPLLIWIGGGAWSYVNRHQEMDLARQFAHQGIAVATIGHRLSSAVWKDPTLNKGIQHPTHVEDLAAAVAWLFQKAEEYGYDPNRIFIGGYSSGGQLAALLTLDKKYLSAYQMEPQQIKGIIPIAGTYDIANYHEVFLNGSRPALAKEHVEAVFGSRPEDWIDASPTNYLDNIQVPILLISERNTYNYTRIFEQALQDKAYQDLTTVHISHLDHAGLWKDLSFSENSVYRDLIAGFIKGKYP